MKAEDLMIGDWVCFDGDENHECPVQIDGISKEEAGVDGDWYDIWEPIPLTSEILEKNGFYKSEVEKRDEIGNYFLERHYAPILFFSISYDDGRDIGNRIEYVHELQHALKLCGIEKEVVL